MRLHQLQDTADNLESAAVALAEQTGKKLKQGGKALSSWEKSAEDSIRSNPMLFAGIGLALIGLLIAKMVYDRRG